MRDFFYNKGDVLITILIIAVAVVVIYFRIGVVMGDPDPGERLKNLVSPIIEYITGDRERGNTEGAGDVQASEDPVTETPEQAESPVVEDTPQDTEPAVTETPAPTENPPEELPGSAAEIKITINAGDAASTIADKLLQAGAIDDKQAFLEEVNAQGAASRLKQGTFTIPAGSSIKDVIAILTA